MQKVIKKIINNFENGRFTTYGDLTELLCCDNVRQVADCFVEVDERCKENGQPPISTLVVNQNGICEDGYFSYHFSHDNRERLVIWSEQVGKIDIAKIKTIFKDYL